MSTPLDGARSSRSIPFRRRFRLDRRSGRAHFRGEVEEIGAIDVRNEGISELTALPEEHVKPARRRLVNAGGAGGDPLAGRKGEPLSAKHEERDGVKPSLEEERRRFAIDEIG